MMFVPIVMLLWNHPCIARPSNDGKSIGNMEAKRAMKTLSSVKADDISPLGEKQFDPAVAHEQVISGKTPKSEAYEFLTSHEVRKNQIENQGFHPDEWFLKHANQESPSEMLKTKSAQETLHQCVMGGGIAIITTSRKLPERFIRVNCVCNGHKKYVNDASKKKMKRDLKEDPSIESFDIRYLGSTTFSGPVWEITWKHKDNSPACDSFTQVEQSNTSNADWVYEDQKSWDFAYTTEATIIDHACVEQNKNGQCTKEQISFVQNLPIRNECDFLLENQCEEIERKCIQENIFGCNEWELTFRCFHHETTSCSAEDIISIDEEVIAKVPNKSFSEVAARLSIFEEAKKELEASKAHDVSRIKIFSGEKQSCSKNIADHLLYDCCFTHSGLAKKIGLAKCNADEISLAEKRELGLCHYMGVHEHKTLGVKTSDEHVFCCFPSKISRIVQEQGRNQLKIGWGTAREPDCSGISFAQLAKMDFSKMDLSEICEQISTKLPEDFERKIENFQNRLKNDLKQET